MKIWKAIFVAVTAAIVVGCKIDPTAPTHSVTPVQPPSVADSVVQIPLHADLAPLIALANSTVPTGFDGSGAWGDTHQSIGGQELWVKMSWSRDAIVIKADNNEVVAGTTVHYKGLAGVSHARVHVAQCAWDNNDPMPSLGLSLVAVLSPQDDWSVLPSVTVPPATIGNRCRLTALNFDVSDRIASTVRDHFVGLVSNFTSSLKSKLMFHDLAAEAWQKISLPYEIPGAPGTFFTLNPKEARLGDLRADPDGKGITVSAGLTAKPILQAGTPVNSQPTPLPPLKTGTAGNQVHIELPLQVSYDTISDAINGRLAGRMYPIGGYQETIDKVAVYGTTQSLVLQVNLSGEAHGVLYLTGSPNYNAVTHVLSIENLDYTVETKNAIAKVADWLLHEHFQDILQSEAHIDLSPQVTALMSGATEAINRNLSPHADISGKVDEVDLLGFVLSDGYVTAYLVGDGSAVINFH